MELNINSDDPFSMLSLDDSKITEITNVQADTSLVCKMCLKKFSDPIELRQHLMEEFEFENDTVSFLDLELGIDGSTEYSTVTAKKLKIQEAISKLNCPVCEKPCKNNKGLEQHKAKAHNHRKKKVLCKICGKNYKHRYALRFHISQVHDRSTRVICTICGEEKYNKYMLSAHIKQDHEELNLIS